MSFRFGGADNASIKLANSFPDGLFISELVDNYDKRIHQFLCKTNFENGSSIFGKRSPDEMQDFRDVCNNALDNCSDEDVATIIQYYVTRIKNYAHIENMWQGRIKEARIISIDKPRTSACEFYEGKIISVERAFNTVQLFKSLSIEDYSKQISTQENKFPPFYYQCRCRLKAIIPGIDNG